MTIRGHWSVLLAPVLPIALGLYLLNYFGVTPVQTLDKIRHVMSRQPPFEWTVAIDLMVWVIIGFGLTLLGGRIAWMITTRVEVCRTGIEHRTGLVHQYTSRIQFKDIECLSLYQSWLGALLGYGTVTVHGHGSATVILKNICNARDLLLHIDQQMAKLPVAPRMAASPSTPTRATAEKDAGVALAG